MIDINKINIENLSHYLLNKNWQNVKEAKKKGWYIFIHPELKAKISIPIRQDYDDIDLVYDKVIRDLAAVYETEPSILYNQIQHVEHDITSFKFFSDQINSKEDFALDSAVEVLSGIKKIILSAAWNINNQDKYIKRTLNNETKAILNKCRFQHTQKGSFIFKVSCPIISEGLFNETPSERKTFINIFEGTNFIKSYIDQGNSTKVNPDEMPPELSYQFCDSLSQIVQLDEDCQLEVSFQWAYNEHLQPPKSNVIRFNHRYVSGIEKIKASLAPKELLKEGTFIGTVEELHGEVNSDNQREGKVILILFIDGEPVRAAATLNAKNYKIADQAHMDSSAYISLNGKLLPGNQPKKLEDIINFKIVE